MIFSSFDFLVFFIIVYFLYLAIPSNFRWVLLLVSSYYFYMYWESYYAVLIFSSTFVDYWVAKLIVREKRNRTRRIYLVFSLIVNLGLLFSFKYYNFFLDVLFDVSSLFDFGVKLSYSELLLPVGISFYTFQTMSYTIDVYRKKIQPIDHFGKFALYVSFFPQLVAGPIERASNLLPQIVEVNKIRIGSNQFISGLSQASFGFFKKVVVADTIALYVDSIFVGQSHHNGLTLLITIYLFGFQIYCDFSGYSDIAIGIARMMGFNFKENFALPYFAKSITEFWRRWHISLSSWLRDYLYISMGGNRRSITRTYLNLMTTMLIGGLWHGASWNFVIWGGIHGLYLIRERLVPTKLTFFGSSALSAFVTFNLVSFSWIFFRSASMKSALDFIARLFDHNHFWNLSIQDTGVFGSILINLPIMLAIEFIFLRKQNWNGLTRQYGIFMAVPVAIFLILITLFGISEGSQFIYFQF